ncbi:MAG: hypothetical protein K9K64_01280 [Desulfohalobiaceae bacterium]|nr:hypothetical protein [Desulfohalobiaceae bacterium]
MPATLLPDWIYRYLVPDSQFEAAFAAVSLQQKSRLKKLIAALHCWYGQTRVFASFAQTDYRQGLQAGSSQKPRDWALIRLDRDAASPALVLATVLPLVLAGVREVIVCKDRADTPFPAALLAALELSGLETVLECPRSAAENLLGELSAASSSGAVVSLSETGRERTGQDLRIRSSGKIPEYALTGPASGGLWIDDPGQWDFESLRFAHPNLNITAWSERIQSLPVPWPQKQGTIFDLRQAEYDVLFLPEERFDPAAAWAPVSLGPGQEGSYVWPDFSLEICYSNRVTWKDLAEEVRFASESR